MSDNLATILAAPSSLVVLAIVLTGLISLLLRSGRHLTISELTTTAMLIALAAVLGYFRIFHMPQGGSVTLGSMLPLLMIAWRFGAGAGALAGFIYGLISLLEDPFIVQPVQVLFDYPLPFMAMGLAGLLPGLRRRRPGLLRTLPLPCHIRRRLFRELRASQHVPALVLADLQRQLPRARARDLLPAALAPPCNPPTGCHDALPTLIHCRLVLDRRRHTIQIAR